MEPLFTTYEEYEQYVKEEWNAGAINELEEANYIIPEPAGESNDIYYRTLTEDEFNKQFKQD